MPENSKSTDRPYSPFFEYFGLASVIQASISGQVDADTPDCSSWGSCSVSSFASESTPSICSLSPIKLRRCAISSKPCFISSNEMTTCDSLIFNEVRSHLNPDAKMFVPKSFGSTSPLCDSITNSHHAISSRSSISPSSSISSNLSSDVYNSPYSSTHASPLHGQCAIMSPISSMTPPATGYQSHFGPYHTAPLSLISIAALTQQTTPAIAPVYSPLPHPSAPTNPHIIDNTTKSCNSNTSSSSNIVTESSQCVSNAELCFKLRVARCRAAQNKDRYNKVKFCVFCRKSGQPEHVQRSHVLKLSDGRVSCPYLRAYVCPICGATGDDSHTMKYCPATQPKIIFT